MFRVVTMMLTGLALMVSAQRLAVADDKDAEEHEGILVKAGDGKLTMTVKGEDKEHTMNVAKDAKISVDGKVAKLADLKKGYHVTVTAHGDHGVIKVVAHSKPPKSNNAH